MTIDIKYFKEKLDAEKTRLEEELRVVGRKNPQNPADWEATPDTGMDNTDPDKNIQADAVEEFEARNAVEAELENQLREVTDALTRIKNNTYGICSVGKEKIEEERLEANPAAKTCMKHLDE